MTNRTCSLRRNASAYGVRTYLGNLGAAIAIVLMTPALALAAPVTILAFGDSLTQGFGLREEEGFVPRLEDWLRTNGAPEAVVVNAGVSGDTTAGGLARIEWALEEDVDAVIVALGGNDLLRGLDPGLARENIEGILEAVDARDLPVLLAGLPAPGNFGAEYKAEFDAIFPDLAEQYDAILYPSFLAGLGKGNDISAVRDQLQPDGIHPNARGVGAIVSDIGPVVLQLVAEAETAE